MPNKKGFLSLRANHKLISLIDSFCPRFSLPGRLASRSYVVQRLIIEGAKALAAQGGAHQGGREEERADNIGKVQETLAEIDRGDSAPAAAAGQAEPDLAVEDDEEEP